MMATDNKPKIQLDKDSKPFIDNETNRQSLNERDSLNKPSMGKQDIIKEEDENPSQKKVNLLNKFREILKRSGADSQQQHKAIIELDNLLFNGDDELDYNGREQEVIRESGNEPAGTPNPNIKVPDANVDESLNKDEK